MAFLELSVAGKTFSVSSLLLCQTCDLFGEDPPPSPYSVTSAVSAEVLEAFAEAVNGNDIEITERNASGLSQLCAEFRCSLLSQ
jgi:hypothetical protein